MPTTGGFLKAGLGALVLAALAAGTVNAADGKGEPEKGKASPFKSRVINAPELAGAPQGMVVDTLRAFEADRRAGRIAKGDEERVLRERIQEAFRLNRSSAGLSAKRTATGATAVDLDGRFQYVLVRHTSSDGTSSVTCVSDADSAAAASSNKPAARTAAEAE